MSHAVALDTRRIALDLHALLKDIDPVRWRDELQSVAHDRLEGIRDQLSDLLGVTWPDQRLLSLQDRLSEISQLVQEHGPADPTADSDAWMQFRAHAQPAYEALAATLRDADVHVPSLRPTNYTRNLIHVFNALWIILLVEVFLNPTTMIYVALGGFTWAWSMEISRRVSPRVNSWLMWVFGPFAHPHEAHRINSATWYATALLVLAAAFTPLQGAVGLAVLGLGDPVAALVGRRFGKFKLINGRTLEGSIAFALFGAGAAMGVLLNFHPEVGLLSAVGIASVAAVVGAVAELLTRRVDDNLAIPVAAAAGAWLVSAAVL